MHFKNISINSFSLFCHVIHKNDISMICIWSVKQGFLRDIFFYVLNSMCLLYWSHLHISKFNFKKNLNN